MEHYTDLLTAAIKTARKMYICEPTREGKLEWIKLCDKLKKERNELQRRPQ
jgi:hypothetical protein